MLAHLLALELFEGSGETPEEPTVEPVTLAEAKVQLRILDDTSQDAKILDDIKAAREWVENESGHILVRRSFTEYFDAFPTYIEIRRRPIVAGSVAITYTDDANDLQGYADPVVRLSRWPARIYPALDRPWPSLGTNGEAAVTYTAGHAQGQTPPLLKQAILTLLVPFYERRDGGPEFKAAENLCNSFRAIL